MQEGTESSSLEKIERHEIDNGKEDKPLTEEGGNLSQRGKPETSASVALKAGDDPIPLRTKKVLLMLRLRSLL